MLNKKAKDQVGQYTLLASFPSEMPGDPYRELGASIICPGAERKNCRNRSFWLFKKIAPELTAKIIFENSVAKNSKLTSCHEFPWFIRKEPR